MADKNEQFLGGEPPAIEPIQALLRAYEEAKFVGNNTASSIFQNARTFALQLETDEYIFDYENIETLTNAREFATGLNNAMQKDGWGGEPITVEAPEIWVQQPKPVSDTLDNYDFDMRAELLPSDESLLPLHEGNLAYKGPFAGFYVRPISVNGNGSYRPQLCVLIHKGHLPESPYVSGYHYYLSPITSELNPVFEHDVRMQQTKEVIMALSGRNEKGEVIDIPLIKDKDLVYLLALLNPATPHPYNVHAFKKIDEHIQDIFSAAQPEKKIEVASYLEKLLILGLLPGPKRVYDMDCDSFFVQEMDWHNMEARNPIRIEEPGKVAGRVVMANLMTDADPDGTLSFTPSINVAECFDKDGQYIPEIDEVIRTIPLSSITRIMQLGA